MLVLEICDFALSRYVFAVSYSLSLIPYFLWETVVETKFRPYVEPIKLSYGHADRLKDDYALLHLCGTHYINFHYFFSFVRTF